MREKERERERDKERQTDRWKEKKRENICDKLRIDRDFIMN